MALKLNHAIKFVADMDKAVAFYRDTLGLPLRFASPEWSEFDTGDVTLALHIASADNPAGKVELGFRADDIAALYGERDARGLTFASPPQERHGIALAKLLDSEGAQVSVSGAPG